MAVAILKLKKDAVAAGMDKETARRASRQELEAFLAKPVKKAPVKKSSAAPAKKKTTSTPARKPAAKKAPARKAATPAKKSAPAKAPAARAAKRPATTSEATGRHSLEGIDYTVTDNWNPRAGSAVETIFKALKRTKGNVQKAFEILVPNIADFVGAKKQDGTKRTKADRENMLMYRINRTNFDFAVKTGQHEVATERAAYGTGAYATTRAVKAKPATRKAAPAKRTAAKPATRRPAAKKTAAKRR